MPDDLASDATGVRELRVGFIGTGLIGTPMVERMLDQGLAISVWNRTAEKTTPLIARGAKAATSARELAADCDIICLCLTNTAAVEDVVFGAGDIAAVLHAGQLIVDFSSIAPDTTLAMATQLRAHTGAHWVDAPVSGGLPAARAGKLIIFAGGDALDIAHAAPVFDALSMRVTHMGGHGAGQLAKSCNQMIVGCNLLVIAEMLSFARAAGIDATQLPAALAGGFADSLPLQIFGNRMARNVDTPKVGAVGTFKKDIDQVARLARESGAFIPMTTRAVELLRDASAHTEVGLDADVSRIIRMFDERRATQTP